MSESSLSFTARRRLQILAPDVDKMVASDRPFSSGGQSDATVFGGHRRLKSRATPL